MKELRAKQFAYATELTDFVNRELIHNETVQSIHTSGYEPVFILFYWYPLPEE